MWFFFRFRDSPMKFFYDIRSVVSISDQREYLLMQEPTIDFLRIGNGGHEFMSSLLGQINTHQVILSGCETSYDD